MRHYRRFWQLFLTWSNLAIDGSLDLVCTSDDIEHAAFFPRVRLNYVENLLSPADPDADDRPALIAVHDDGRPPERLTRGEVRHLACVAGAGLREHGIVPGDRVVAILRNDTAAVVAALGCAAIGAVFASAAPQMGVSAILNRFSQLDPKALIWAAGTDPRSLERLAEIVRGLPALGVVVTCDDDVAPEQVGLPTCRLVSPGMTPIETLPRFPFNHPLFILFSSGTTGAPKCIVARRRRHPA